MTSPNQMLNNTSSFPGVDPIITQVPEAQLPDTGSEENLNSSFSSDAAKASLSRAIKLPYQATHQVELLHLHAEIEALLQQVRTLKQQRLSDSDHSALSDRSILAIR